MTSPEEMEELFEQLPFYVNGTVTQDLRRRIEAALPSSPKLREALAQARHIQSRILAGTGELLDESEPHYETRKASVMAGAALHEQLAPQNRRISFASALSFLNPRRWNPAIALTLALALPAQAAVIASQSTAIDALEKENFRLASGPCADHDRTRGIVLELKEDAMWKAVAELLDAEALVIVENGAFGVLTVRGEKKGAERAALIGRLKQSPLISSAVPEA
jgi:hypothetical protein